MPRRLEIENRNTNMFVTTFYSYKGGVGRTSALVNTAYRLARRGKRVFVLDFDLEAPGLDAYGLCNTEEPRPGLVEYLSAFMETGTVPQLHEYVLESTLPGIAEKLCLMSAGKKDDAYRAALSQLDWKVLYRQKKGYFLMENLKAAIQEAFKPDYLLVDSRTGLTDISGICTLQLPNLVVLLFSLNQQNINGISPILRAIKSNKINRNIATLLVASPVPDMPQWVEARRERFEYARKTMGSAAEVVLPYDPFLAFKESIIDGFEGHQSNSYLGKAYDSLVEKIISANATDVLTLLKAAIAYKNEGNHDLAALKFREVIEIRPDSPEAWLEFGKFEKIQRKFKEACEYFEKAHLLAPRDCETLAQLATTFVYTDKLKCEEYFRKFLSLENDAQHILRVSEIVRIGLPELALEGFMKSTSLDPANPSTFIALGQTRMRLKHYREAADAYRHALEMSPNSLVNMFNLGTALARVGDERANSYFAKAIDIWEQTDNSGANRASLANQCEAMSHAYSALGRFDTAVKLLENALAVSQELEDSRIFSSLHYDYVSQKRFVLDIQKLLDTARRRAGTTPGSSLTQ